MNIKLHIPLEKYENKVGGPNTFVFNLKNFLGKQGVNIIKDENASNVILFPIAHDLEILKKLKSKKTKIIQRLDGIYYPGKHSPEQIKFNELVKEIYINYADFVIFQSEYSKRQCFKMLGEVSSEKYKTVINGVDASIFYPGDKSEFSDTIKFVATSHFRNLDMIEPIIKALDEIKLNKKFELHLVGPIVNSEIEELIKRDYVIYHGSQDLYGVAKVLRECDIYLYSSLNPPCPNAVIEAISTGLPVVSFDSGSMSELCYFAKELLAFVSNDLFQKYKDFDYRKLMQKIELVVKDFKNFKQIALENSKIYDFENCGKEYLKVIEAMQLAYEEEYYDNRYATEDYRTKLSSYEVARVDALSLLVKNTLRLQNPENVLDYGSGNGLHVDLWEKLFPNSKLHFADISKEANRQLVDKFPEYKNTTKLISEDRVDFQDNTFDVIFSIEVMEHVQDLNTYLTEVKRLLKPGGLFIWTTPCGNSFSVEHIYNSFTNNIEKTSEGYRRWKWEDPSHIRRLKTSEIKEIMLNDIKFSKVNFKFRAHFFSFVSTKLMQKGLISEGFAIKLMKLDYNLFRNLPNGASMVGYAKK